MIGGNGKKDPQDSSNIGLSDTDVMKIGRISGDIAIKLFLISENPILWEALTSDDWANDDEDDNSRNDSSNGPQPLAKLKTLVDYHFSTPKERLENCWRLVDEAKIKLCDANGNEISSFNAFAALEIEIPQREEFGQSALEHCLETFLNIKLYVKENFENAKVANPTHYLLENNIVTTTQTSNSTNPYNGVNDGEGSSTTGSFILGQSDYDLSNSNSDHI